MYKLKIGSISLGKLTKNISYRLGFFKRPTTHPEEQINELSQTANASVGCQYPHQQEELEKVYRDEILPKIEDARAKAKKLIF